MKKLICSILLLVILLTSLSVAAFAENYFETYDVANAFFGQGYTTVIPHNYSSLDWPGVANYAPGIYASASTMCRFGNIAEEYGHASVMICGDEYITNGPFTTLEVCEEDIDGDNTGTEYEITATAYCEESTKAVKIRHYVVLEDSFGRSDRYELIYVCPEYYELYGESE